MRAAGFAAPIRQRAEGHADVINTVGHLAERAWHHPDLTASMLGIESGSRSCRHGNRLRISSWRKKSRTSCFGSPEGRGRAEGTPAESAFAYIDYKKAMLITRQVNAAHASCLPRMLFQAPAIANWNRQISLIEGAGDGPHRIDPNGLHLNTSCVVPRSGVFR